MQGLDVSNTAHTWRRCAGARGTEMVLGASAEGCPSLRPPRGLERVEKQFPVVPEQNTRARNRRLCAFRASRTSGPRVPRTTRARAGPLGSAGSRTFAQGRRVQKAQGDRGDNHGLPSAAWKLRRGSHCLSPPRSSGTSRPSPPSGPPTRPHLTL